MRSIVLLCVCVATAVALVASPVTASVERPSSSEKAASSADVVPPVGAPFGACAVAGGDRTTCDNTIAGRRCTWNSFTQSCMPECYGLPEYQCEQCSMCRWEDNTCRFSCPFRTSNDTAGACEAAGRCYSDGNANVCANSCRYGTEAACNADGACQFNSITGACEVSCWGHSIPYVCNQDPRCQWYGKDATPSDLTMPYCGPVTPAPPTTPVPPTPPPTPAPPPTCAGAGQNQFACERLSFCFYNAYTSMCEGLCTLKHEQSECKLQGSCVWNYRSARCTPACSFTGLKGAACDAQPDCQWDDYYKTCRVNCTKVASPQVCDETTACVWGVNETTPTCIKPCGGYDVPLWCNWNPNCYWQWRPNGKCLPANQAKLTTAVCAKHHGKRGDCLLAGCDYNTEASTCLRP